MPSDVANPIAKGVTTTATALFAVARGSGGPGQEVRPDRAREKTHRCERKQRREVDVEECHGREVRESDVDLRTVTAMLRGGTRGPVVARGHPEFSDLVEQIVEIIGPYVL